MVILVCFEKTAPISVKYSDTYQRVLLYWVNPRLGLVLGAHGEEGGCPALWGCWHSPCMSLCSSHTGHGVLVLPGEEEGRKPQPRLLVAAKPSSQKHLAFQHAPINSNKSFVLCKWSLIRGFLNGNKPTK